MLAAAVQKASWWLDPWVIFGFAAQGLFAARFVWQWFVSERRGRSTIPVGFWFLSLAGGAMLFVYALRLGDPVFIVGQGLGVVIYVRNLMLIYNRRAGIRRRHPRLAGPNGPPAVDEPEGEKDMILP